jgi:hypothetical protein
MEHARVHGTDAGPTGNASRLVGGRPKRNQTRPQLLALDLRTSAGRAFDRLRGAIISDLGGAANVTAVENCLIDAFAGAAVTVGALNTKLLSGEAINLAEHAQAISAMVRVATRLGTSRRARDLGPNLDAYLNGQGPAQATFAPSADEADLDLDEADQHTAAGSPAQASQPGEPAPSRPAPKHAPASRPGGLARPLNGKAMPRP